MDYLTLCQRLRQECRAAGNGPLAVTGQTGKYADFVNWIADAWTDIQTENGGYWNFLRKPFRITTVADQSSYASDDPAVQDVETAAAITRFRRWRIMDRYKPPKVYRQSQGLGTQRWLIQQRWEAFDSVYGIGTQNPGAPSWVSESPDKKIHLGPIPNDVFIVDGEYYRSAQILTGAGHEPECPAEFHMAIVFRAMIDYAYNEVAPELLERAERRYKEVHGGLLLDQSEQMQFRKARPLVE